METESFSIPSISCPKCVAKIEREIGNLAGVATIDVDLETKSVDVTVSSSYVRDAIAEALVRLGYPPRQR